MFSCILLYHVHFLVEAGMGMRGNGNVLSGGIREWEWFFKCVNFGNGNGKDCGNGRDWEYWKPPRTYTTSANCECGLKTVNCSETEPWTVLTVRLLEEGKLSTKFSLFWSADIILCSSNYQCSLRLENECNLSVNKTGAFRVGFLIIIFFFLFSLPYVVNENFQIDQQFYSSDIAAVWLNMQ